MTILVYVSTSHNKWQQYRSDISKENGKSIYTSLLQVVQSHRLHIHTYIHRYIHTHTHSSYHIMTCTMYIVAVEYDTSVNPGNADCDAKMNSTEYNCMCAHATSTSLNAYNHTAQSLLILAHKRQKENLFCYEVCIDLHINYNELKWKEWYN